MSSALEDGAFCQQSYAQQLPSFKHNERYGDDGDASHLVKALIMYMQHMLIIASAGVGSPAILPRPLQALSWVWSLTPYGSSSAGTVDCMLNSNGIVPVAIQRVLFYVSAPVAVAVLLFSAYCAVLWAVKTAQQKSGPVGVVYSRVHIGLVDRFVSFAVIITSIFLPGIVQVAFSMFSCLPVDRSFPASYCPAAVMGSSSSMLDQTLISVDHSLTSAEGSAAAATLYWIFDGQQARFSDYQSMGVDCGSVVAIADLHHSYSIGCCDFIIFAQ